MSALKGLVVYSATLAFAGLYGYFIVRISVATGGPPKIDSVLLSAAAALAGVLGSAFALEVGTTTPPSAVNNRLGRALTRTRGKKRWLLRLHQVLSLDASSSDSASWPKTLGIWVYALVAAAVAVTYALNQNQTPAMIKALAVAFAGYVIALITAAYKENEVVASTTPAVTPVPAVNGDGTASKAHAGSVWWANGPRPASEP